MRERDRIKLLFGPYRMPKCKVGRWLRCAIRGMVRVQMITDALIMWPATRFTNWPTLIVCGDLARAVRKESATAVAHHWGVTLQTVWTWRKALGVGHVNPGTSALRKRWAPDTVNSIQCRTKAIESTQRPERNAKISAARRGKPRPAHVVEAIRRAHIGWSPSDEARQKMRDAAKRRGAYPPEPGDLSRRKKTRSWARRKIARLRRSYGAT